MQKLLKNLQYPCGKQNLINKARGEGANQNVLDALERLPEQEFEPPADVSEELGKTE